LKKIKKNDHFFTNIRKGSTKAVVKTKNKN